MASASLAVPSRKDMRRHRTLSLSASTEMARRTSFSLQGALRPVRDGNLFEAFVVVGLPCDKDISEKVAKNPQEPEILFQFPPDKDLSKLQITQFCFPSGLVPELVKRSLSESGKNSFLYGSLSQVEEGNKSFVFLLTTDKHLLYGVCVVVDELLRTNLSFTTQRVWHPTHRELNHIVAPRAYCFLSRFPFFKLHFDVLYSLIGRERLYRIEDEVGQHFPPLQDNEIIKLLHQYFSVSVPREEQTLSVKLPNEIRALEFSCPPGSEDTLIVDTCLASLIQLLPVEMILTIVSALAQEFQIVVVCQNLSILSSVVLSFIPLLRPLIWQGAFIPVLPRELQECLHAPVPYVMGVDTILDLSSTHSQYVMVIDVDKRQIVQTPHGLCELPNLAPLAETLKLLVGKLYLNDEDEVKRYYKTPYGINKKFSPQSLQEVVEIVRQNQQNVLESLRQVLPPKLPDFPANPAVADILGKITDPITKAFCQRLVETQLFNFFYEKHWQ